MTEHSLPYITGMGYRKLCDFVYDEFQKTKFDDANQFDNMKIFVKTDFLFSFIQKELPSIKKKFFLYTHNSDFEVDEKYLIILNSPHLILWYGQNINYKHEKLKSIPIGLANKRWSHGNVSILEKIIKEDNKKNNLVYCNFDVNTNPKERKNCLKEIFPIVNSNKVDFEMYLRKISESFFVISPNGNGIDCHKNWESFYLKSIPIVTKSINIDNFVDYPFLIIDDWKNFKDLELSESLYYSIWNKFDTQKLFLKDEL